MNFFASHISRGTNFVRNNPQLLYTLFLMLVIPLAFVWSGQKFLEVSTENQERLEKERVGSLQDSFALLAARHLDDSVFLQSTLSALKKTNDAITEFSVARNDKTSGPVIVASLDASSIGLIDTTNKTIYRQFEGFGKESSVILPALKNDDRHWRAYRTIVSPETGETLGFLLTEISMARIDAIAAESVARAYILLGFIILAIVLLLIRQARIIDYTVLYRRLREIDQMKDDFISMTAHELRTPLTVIRGYADVLKSVVGIPDAAHEHIQRIDLSAERLILLVNDILDVSRLEQGRMSFSPTDLNLAAEIAPLLETFRPVAVGKGLALSFEAAGSIPLVSADRDRLKQALTNIIGNAIKYTPSGTVSVKLSAERDHVITRVSDTGMGISAEDQKRLFGKFFRVKSAETNEIVGTGLGLWITREIVRVMQGDITVESIKGKGTDFIISFPSKM